METSLPTPMTARVQLLIYQRVALLLLKHSFCCTIFPIFDDSMWMVVSLRHTYPTYALARWEEQWYPTVEQHTAIPLQHIYTRRSLVWRHCHINPCTSIIKSETIHFSQSFKHHFSSNPQFSWWIPSWWTASISYWCGLYKNQTSPSLFVSQLRQVLIEFGSKNQQRLEHDSGSCERLGWTAQDFNIHL